MDASDAAAVVVAVASALAVFVLVFAIYALNRTLRELRSAIEDVRRETLPVVSEMRAAVGQANAELERVDTLWAPRSRSRRRSTRHRVSRTSPSRTR